MIYEAYSRMTYEEELLPEEARELAESIRFALRRITDPDRPTARPGIIVERDVRLADDGYEVGYWPENFGLMVTKGGESMPAKDADPDFKARVAEQLAAAKRANRPGSTSVSYTVVLPDGNVVMVTIKHDDNFDQRQFSKPPSTVMEVEMCSPETATVPTIASGEFQYDGASHRFSTERLTSPDGQNGPAGSFPDYASMMDLLHYLDEPTS